MQMGHVSAWSRGRLSGWPAGHWRRRAHYSDPVRHGVFAQANCHQRQFHDSLLDDVRLLSYAGLITIDWTLLGVTTIGGMSGGFIGNRIMHAKLQNADIKNVLCLVLCLVGFKMLYDILAV